MLSQEIGAFEAKTHFSKILKEVEKGAVYIITKRGKPVAMIVPYKQENRMSVEETINSIRELQKLCNDGSKEINIKIRVTDI